MRAALLTLFGLTVSGVVAWLFAGPVAGVALALAAVGLAVRATRLNGWGRRGAVAGLSAVLLASVGLMAWQVSAVAEALGDTSGPVAPGDPGRLASATVKLEEASASAGFRLERKHRRRPRVETHLSGPGLMSVREWEAEGSPGERVKRRTAKMSRLVTIETATICAEILGARVERHGLTVTVHAAWDSPAGVALRRWSRDPDGSLEWSRMLHTARTATGEAPTEEVPLEVYDRQLSLEAIA